MTQLSLPPLYVPVIAGPAADVRGRARKLAQEGGASGTFVWAERDDRLECAVILRPEQSLESSRPVVLVAALALDDAIGSNAPPGLESDLVYPGIVRVNGGRVGGVDLVADPDCGERDIPSWLVVAASLRITGSPGIEAGENPTETCLREEGCANATARSLAAAFARAFVHWTDRWLDDGLRQIARHWLHRATRHDGETVVTVGDDLVAGTIDGLDDSGGLILATDSARRVIPLRDALVSSRAGTG